MFGKNKDVTKFSNIWLINVFKCRKHNTSTIFCRQSLGERKILRSQRGYCTNYPEDKTPHKMHYYNVLTRKSLLVALTNGSARPLNADPVVFADISVTVAAIVTPLARQTDITFTLEVIGNLRYIRTYTWWRNKLENWQELSRSHNLFVHFCDLILFYEQTIYTTSYLNNLCMFYLFHEKSHPI